MSRTVLGLDLGQASEFTALSVVERDAADQTLLAVRHLVRFPPGTPYAKVGEAVASVIRDGGLGRPPLIADLTAVGPTLLPSLRGAVRPSWVVPVVLTAGQTIAGKDDDGTWRLPKRDLVTTLQLLLQGRRLRVAPALPDAALLVQELTAFRARVCLSDADTLDWRERPADDLVLAVALASWWAERWQPLTPGSISFGGSMIQEMLDRVFPPEPSPW
jgi:hypothetical protein